MRRVVAFVTGWVLVASLGVVAPVVAQSTRGGSSRAATGVRVSGSVVKVHPAVPDPTEVVLSTAPGERWPPGPMIRVPVRADGTFVFEDIPPGDYSLSLAPWVQAEPVPVTVGTTNVTSVRLEAVGRTNVAVRARMADEGPVPEMVRIHAQRGELMATGFVPRGVSVAPGKNYLFAVPPAGYFVASFTSEGVNLLREPIDIAVGAPDREAEVVLSRTRPADVPTATIKGRVTGDRAGAEVELVNATGMNPMGQLFDVASVGADGAFEFRDVPVGIYHIGLSPAQRIVKGVVALGGETHVEVPVPSGTLFAATPVVVVDQSGRQVTVWRGKLSLIAEAGGQRTVFPIERLGFWGTLPPGLYHVAIEGLSPGFSVRSLSAGSANLLTSPFVVPPNRPAETINIVLQHDPSLASE